MKKMRHERQSGTGPDAPEEIEDQLSGVKRHGPSFSILLFFQASQAATAIRM